MARFLSKSRRKFLLPALLVLTAFLFLWYRGSHRESARGKFFHSWVLSMAPRFQKSAGWVLGLPERSTETFKKWISLKNENERLTRECQALELELVRQRGVEAELQTLEKTLKMKPPSIKHSRLARIIVQDAGTWNRSFVIDAGADEGVKEDAPVLSVQGLAGRVWTVSGGTSRILGILDSASSVAGIDVRSRVKGLARGTGHNRLKFEYVNAGSDIEPGDLIVTSGMGGVFPKNIPLGTVVKKSLSENGMTLDVELAPTVDFGSLEHVFVLESPNRYEP